jgi:hypothetical protein
LCGPGFELVPEANRLRRFSLLHGEFRQQAFATAENRRDSQSTVSFPEPQPDIMGAGIAVLLDSIPALGVTDVRRRAIPKRSIC